MAFKTSHALIFTATLIAVVFSVRTASAFDANDLENLNVDFEYVNENGDGSEHLTCQVAFGDLIDKASIGYLKQSLEDSFRDLLQSVQQYAVEYVNCWISNLQITVFGSGQGSTPVNCNKSLGGKMESLLERQAQDKFEQETMKYCIADQTMQKVLDAVRAMLGENGPNGGPAWVTSYTDTLYILPDRQAQRRVWAILANTSICGYFRTSALDYFGVPESYRNNPPAIGGNGFAVSGGAPFQLRASCSLPKNYTSPTTASSFNNLGGYNLLSVLAQPQNNLNGFIQMVNTELDEQRSALRNSAQAQVVGGGGFLPFVAECQRDSEGYCLDDGRIRQPAAGVRDVSASLLQANIDQINLGDETRVRTDVARRFATLAFDISEIVPTYAPQAGSSLRKYADIGEGKREPDKVSIPTPTPNPDDISCTSGIAGCTCVSGNSSYEQVSQTILLQATKQAILNHPELVTLDQASVLPGQNYAFLQAVCDASPLQPCRPSSISSSQILLSLSPTQDISFDLITPANVIRQPGRPVALCPAGVQ